MADIRFVHPINQPTGDFRLLDWLSDNFQSSDYDTFKCLAAFAKIKPFYKLHEYIQKWNEDGKQSEVILGVDHKGTSYQALQYARANFSTVRILHVDYSTFHPKLYIFQGTQKATAYYGSSNFTSGGLETNFEGGTIFTFKLPADQALFDELCISYTSLLTPGTNCTKILTEDFLQELNQREMLLDEDPTKRTTQSSGAKRTSRTQVSDVSEDPLFPPFAVKPAKAIPKSLMTAAAASAGIIVNSPPKTKSQTTLPSGQTTRAQSTKPIVLPLLVDGFVIQISPHHNGEIFLSKLGVDQNKAFFGYPFSGRTVPKKAGKPAYPQREPDPIVNIKVFDSTGTLVNTVTNYNLNTVYYEAKSEIRITITPSILDGLRLSRGSTDYPILVMSNSSEPGCDYDMYFYAKGSQVYDDYLSICNQTLPSGGKPVARKMGWI